MRTPGSKSAQSGACISRSAADRMTEAPTSPESDSGEPDSSAPDCCGSPAPAVGGTNSGVGEPLGGALAGVAAGVSAGVSGRAFGAVSRSEEHTSELQSLMRISYAVFCLKKKISRPNYHTPTTLHPTHFN